MRPQPPAAANQTCRRGGLRMCRDYSTAGAPRSCVKELHEMCLVPNEHISDTIGKLGHFPDCEWLVKAWRSHDDPEMRGARQPDTFVDAGANIGACSLEMLLRTDARVVAFEPSPVNRFYLTRSLRMAAIRDPSISRRIVVVPFALGAHYQQSQLHLSGGGSAVMPSIAGGGTTWNATNDTAAIEMRSLDDTLAPDLRIRLLKLDVQGYECEVLKGASRLLRSHRVLALTAEIDRALLGAQGCDADALRALIQQDTWFNVTRRPTMSESTFFAHRCGALFCEKHKAICRMEMNGPGSCSVRPEPSATRTIAPV